MSQTTVLLPPKLFINVIALSSDCHYIQNITIFIKVLPFTCVSVYNFLIGHTFSRSEIVQYGHAHKSEYLIIVLL